MSSTKKLSNITAKQISTKGVQALSDRPNVSSRYGEGGLSPAQLKLWFDSLATFLAGKINEIQDVIAGDDAASYIRLSLDEYGIENLNDLTAAFTNGVFSSRVLRVYPSVASSATITLQALVNDIAQSIANLKLADQTSAAAFEEGTAAEQLKVHFGEGLTSLTAALYQLRTKAETHDTQNETLSKKAIINIGIEYNYLANRLTIYGINSAGEVVSISRIDLEFDFSDVGLNVVDGALCVTYQEET